jgi:P27 family predicted phage terminase small subunit
MDVIEGTGEIVAEPDWSLALSDPLEVAAAREHWRRISADMREAGTLAPGNAHSMQRLVNAYLVYDRAAREVTENGAVMKPKRGNPKAIARVSPYFTAMREAGSDAALLEDKLGVSPYGRNKVGKAQQRKRKSSAAANYLKPVAK